MGLRMRTLIALLIIAGVFQCTTGTSYTVGGTTGWALGIGPTFYDDWASKFTFVTSDVLVFTYPGGSHNVFEVTKADLESCNLKAPIKTYETSGGASVTLTTPGEHYYICGVPGHCLLNMQMTVLVSAASTPKVAPKLSPKSSPTPSPKSLSPAPTPAPESLSPAPAPDVVVPVPTGVPTPGLPNSVAPAPAVGTSGASTSTDGSALAIITLGTVLCVVTSLLFQ